MPFLADVDQTSKILKICSKNVLDMVGASFESLKAIVSEKILFIKFLYFFVPFWNLNGIVMFSFFTVLNNTVLVPKMHKKV